MATSGSTNFSVSRNDIIKMAYQKIGVVAEGDSPNSNQYTEGSLLLNGIVKSWSVGLKIPLWSLRYGAIFPQSLTTPHSVLLGSTGGHASTEILHTTLTADAASSATSLTVGSITSFAASDNIGIELDNGDIHWTTINGAPSGSTIVITTGLASAAASGNHIWAYTTKIDRPVRIVEAWTRDYTTSTDVRDIPMEVITPEEYNMITNKVSESYPLKICYEPLIDNGVARYWPGFSDGSKIIMIRYHRVLEDFDGATDTPDFPQEYFYPLFLELAVAAAGSYSLSIEERRDLRSERDYWVKMVLANDYEEGSIKFYPKTQL